MRVVAVEVVRVVGVEMMRVVGVGVEAVRVEMRVAVVEVVRVEMRVVGVEEVRVVEVEMMRVAGVGVEVVRVKVVKVGIVVSMEVAKVYLMKVTVVMAKGVRCMTLYHLWLSVWSRLIQVWVSLSVCILMSMLMS